MRALDELLAQARRRGLAIEARPSAPAYLADAVRRACELPRSGEEGAKLWVWGGVEPIAVGDWFVLDLPGGADYLAPRRLAEDLA
ncbi:MAG: hypothetical protein LBO20_08710, partial [Bifidobacteriaceae bacterium]|nr:hypothetical protein [Bifidobacteriaceae bacterium]